METFKSKAKEYSIGLVPPIERRDHAGNLIVERGIVQVQFHNYTYLTKQEGHCTAEEVEKLLHDSKRYNIDFVSTASEGTKREMGDFKVSEEMEPCEYCGRDTFKTKMTRAWHVKSCEKKAMERDKGPANPEVITEHSTSPEVTDGTDDKASSV